MPEPWNVEWLNENSLRAYPIKEDVRRMPVDEDGVVLTDTVLPNSILVDMVLTTASPTAKRVYLAQLAYVGDLLTFVFKDDGDIQVGTVTVTPSTHTKYDSYSFAGVDEYDDARGAIVVGDLTNLADELAEGLYTFTLALAELEPRVVRPALRGVRSLQIVSSGVLSDFIYGHVTLVAGNNVLLTYVEDENAIRIDAISGEGLNEECECEDQLGQNNIIRTINGIPIEDVIIQGDGQCVEVNTSGDTITIIDKCSEPCCDCPELEFLTESLKILESTVTRLENYSQELETRINQFVMNYILTIAAI
jgi:hypothetical protein